MISDDRRQREERRKLKLGSTKYALDRRQDIQRRVLDLGTLSIDEWLANHSTTGDLRHKIRMIAEN